MALRLHDQFPGLSLHTIPHPPFHTHGVKFLFVLFFKAVRSLASSTLGGILGTYKLTNLLSDRWQQEQEQEQEQRQEKEKEQEDYDEK